MTMQLRVRTRAEPASKQKLRLWIRLIRASRAIEIGLRERLRVEFATTLPQFDVMAALARKPTSMTMTELSRLLMVSNGNVTGIVERLAADAMVKRLTDTGDRRATLVQLTDKGAKHFAAMARAHESWVNEILAGVTREEADALIDLLKIVKARASGGKHEE